ncbi:MAG: phage tail protein [Ilumatobacter sp.]|uniref:phage tail protein n=1 Tax=Ilumatobacter sp. TaxID=1967498 RepID=UPI00261CA902|nr:phage tail protein [Ilumatobacter sp.]MDJ0770656.1 phage tail protein [Ilumatobacter sp.]
MSELAVQAGFKVTIDNCPLGTFAKCEGLKATYAVKSYEEGGQNGYVHQLPGRLSYENITLTRAVSTESLGLATWFSAYQSMVKRSTARITVMDPAGEEVVTWNLMGVFPVSWSAGALDAEASGALIETLVIAHEGFFDLTMTANVASL